MCDDFTLADDAEWQAMRRVSRRGFGLGAAGLAAGGALAGCMASNDPNAAPTPTPSGLAIAERAVTIPTPDGAADAFFAYPAKGGHAAVLVWPDILGLRDSFKDKARDLARAGYAALVVNHYYRSAKAPVLPTGASFTDPAVRAAVAPMGKALSPATYASDGKAFVAWLDRQPQVDSRRKIGTVGHCMTGGATIRTAAAAPDRIGVAASMHGGGLVTDAPDSPHRLIAATRAALLIAIAQNDDAREPGAKTTLREACDAAGRSCEIEVYPANHGWTVADSPSYDAAQADRAFQRQLAHYAKL
ncbi:dienelactone hydrolase family protein [Novosphingobium sp. Gsoil 351]|uniref:dienelactone hydrolase family protein n=1 Tax=Novosphingobium sp. Gsoil 351 TaxID=2675225 RepID=UPI0012B500EB|nr:dienelactone hydrolase family protein [Novosphingobium sp. Gsoil 351]QGN53238.1 dienelactone hydrolase family protein [Novosphingobium sp. Gsoil 351]